MGHIRPPICRFLNQFTGNQFHLLGHDPGHNLTGESIHGIAGAQVIRQQLRLGRQGRAPHQRNKLPVHLRPIPGQITPGRIRTIDRYAARVFEHARINRRQFFQSGGRSHFFQNGPGRDFGRNALPGRGLPDIRSNRDPQPETGLHRHMIDVKGGEKAGLVKNPLIPAGYQTVAVRLDPFRPQPAGQLIPGAGKLGRRKHGIVRIKPFRAIHRNNIRCFGCCDMVHLDGQTALFATCSGVKRNRAHPTRCVDNNRWQWWFRLRHRRRHTCIVARIAGTDTAADWIATGIRGRSRYRGHIFIRSDLRRSCARTGCRCARCQLPLCAGDDYVSAVGHLNIIQPRIPRVGYRVNPCHRITGFDFRPWRCIGVFAIGRFFDGNAGPGQHITKILDKIPLSLCQRYPRHSVKTLVRIPGLNISAGDGALVDTYCVIAGRQSIEKITAAGIGDGFPGKFRNPVAVKIAFQDDPDAGNARLTGTLGTIGSGVIPQSIADCAETAETEIDILLIFIITEKKGGR